MADRAEQRLNMVESQVRPSDITDRRILRAMQDIARDAFVPKELSSLAYSDAALTLPTSPGGPVRKMLSPRIIAKLLQATEVASNEVVLDVGCATGYGAALLSKIAETVVALEEDPQLSNHASKALTALGADNVAVVTQPLAAGYAKAGPYDVIVIEGAIEKEPDALIRQLKENGRLIAIKGKGPSAKACLWRKTGESAASTERFDASALVLPGFEAQPIFSL